jgi:microcystin-dependent protein
MSCQGCFNGCVETTSDKCIKYTGEEIVSLGIENGDSLFVIEKALTDYLLTVMDGTGITTDIERTTSCDLFDTLAPSEGNLTLAEALIVFKEAVCSLQDSIDTINDTLIILNDDYDVDCLDGAGNSDDTHIVLQATIDKLCALITLFDALALDLSQNYELKSDVDADIAAYIAANVSTKYYTKMIPYVAVEFYDDLTGKFDATGAGLEGSNWEQIYLCNGDHLTPDKRGRIPVGTTNIPEGTVTMDTTVKPNGTTNPDYDLKHTEGSNSVLLGIAEMPSHHHDNTLTDPTHTHIQTEYEAGYGEGGGAMPVGWNDDVMSDMTGPYATEPNSTGISITNVNEGGGGAHSNIPPVLACHYIMHIPIADYNPY